MEFEYLEQLKNILKHFGVSCNINDTMFLHKMVMLKINLKNNVVQMRKNISYIDKILYNSL